MIRGTTPTHTFTLPFDASTFKTIRVIYSQGSEPTLVKTGDEVKASGNTLTVKLTQDDTLKFSTKSVVKIQIRLLSHDGEALASDIMCKSALELLENEVIA